jgi:glutamate---cysteine ligase / carboxylate-amine ligase
VTLTPDAGDLWESNFGSEPAFSLGVEEEVLLVDERNRIIDGRGDALIDDADPATGEIDTELFSAMAESKSSVSANAGEALRALRAVRREILAGGGRILAAGVHPTTEPGEARIQDTSRYTAIEDALRGVLRTPICGQHVHVGMPDKEVAVRAYNGIRTHVPLINALAANSPFWFGADSGLASSRTVIFRSYPRAAMAPRFDDFREFCRVTHQVCEAAGLHDYTQIWWDARIHPGLGTIEIRAADTQTDLRRAAAIAALIHCLSRIEAERDQSDIPAREALAESSFQATRHGLEAQLLDRDAERVPARELGRRTVALAGEVAGELGCESELGYVERILEDGCGADQQRAVFAERGMDGLLDHLVAASAELHEDAFGAG